MENENKMKRNIEIDENQICDEYVSTNIGTEALALKYHIGKKRVKDILRSNGIETKKKGKQPLKDTFVTDWRVMKYVNPINKHYVAYDDKSAFESDDIENKSGILTTYIEKTYGVETPTLYDRRKYYMKTGNYWWEQWLKVRLEENAPTKKCPYCDWETNDIDNLSGMFGVHLSKAHGLTIEEHLKKHPEDGSYFSKQLKAIIRKEHLKKDGCSVTCPLCGKRFNKLTAGHIKSAHNMEWMMFKELYPDIKLVSDEAYAQAIKAQAKTNLVVSKKRFISSYEREIHKMLDCYGVSYDTNRQILIGKEIDILVPSSKIGIEFDGLKFHTEFFGRKPQRYHLDKTLRCNEKGYGLIHIFEDEYVNHKEIVDSKIKHALGLNKGLPSIGARKCTIRHIYKHQAKTFLDKNHIQGYAPSSVYLGAFYGDLLVAVMSFKNGTIKNRGWELTRFATDINYRCPGIASKLFSVFLREYEPFEVFSFADRRWTVDMNNNVYTKMGFIINKVSNPDYRYYNERIDRYKRVHKMTMNKKAMSKKYGFDLAMTELEMARELGYDRIWDCGLIKYVYKK